jgi:hypothetical protein
MISTASQMISKSSEPSYKPRQEEHDGKVATAEQSRETEEKEEAHRRFVEETLSDDRRIWHEVA